MAKVYCDVRDCIYQIHDPNAKGTIDEDLCGNDEVCLRMAVCYTYEEKENGNESNTI